MLAALAEDAASVIPATAKVLESREVGFGGEELEPAALVVSHAVERLVAAYLHEGS